MPERDPTLETPARAGFREALALLGRNPDFRNLYVAQLISYGGDWFLTVALFGLVHDVTQSSLMVALTLVAQEIPFFFMSPVGGVLADRLDRRRLMIAADLFRAALCVGFLAVGDRGDLWLAFALLAVISSFSATFDPAASAAVPNLVDEEDLGLANSLVGSAWGTMLAVGAGLGGVVAATFGRDTAFLVDAASFLVSAALLSRIRRRLSERRAEEHAGMLAATKETFHYARRDHRVLALLAVKGGFGLAAGVIVLIAVFATDVFKAGDVGIGILMAARGVGALVGPFLGRWVAGADDRRLFPAIGLSLAVFGASYIVFGLMPSLLLAAPMVMCAHLGGGAQWALSTYGLQRIVPDRIRGRVFAFDFALVTLSIAVSSIGAGWAAERWGPRPAVVVLAGVALAWALVWWTATRGVRRAPKLEGWGEAEPEIV
ncbi:MAG: MFS transporter [Actinobacteria bacterium]|nr:MFS transporter [Actinomycetota bacterium]